jgi:hypothetical protein
VRFFRKIATVEHHETRERWQLYACYVEEGRPRMELLVGKLGRYNRAGELAWSPFVHGVYVHYKGGRYRTVAVAHHDESGAPYVVYVCLERGTLNARPVLGTPEDPDGWLTPVLVDGVEQSRFESEPEAS